MTLSLTDTVSGIATARLRATEEARLARIRGSKTNLEYLMNAGVIVTCDDAYENALRDEMLAQRAKDTGVTFDEAEKSWRQERAEDNVRSDLRWSVSLNETHAEHVARRDALMAAAEGVMPSGRKCKHNSTKKDIGWVNKVGFFNMMATNDNGDWEFQCCRCNATVTVPALKEPTEQAKIAAVILAA